MNKAVAALAREPTAGAIESREHGDRVSHLMPDAGSRAYAADDGHYETRSARLRLSARNRCRLSAPAQKNLADLSIAIVVVDAFAGNIRVDGSCPRHRSQWLRTRGGRRDRDPIASQRDRSFRDRRRCDNDDKRDDSGDPANGARPFSAMTSGATRTCMQRRTRCCFCATNARCSRVEMIDNSSSKLALS
ncbi:MAG: hypothetical protein ABI846_04560 [Rudaea sp.]